MSDPTALVEEIRTTVGDFKAQLEALRADIPTDDKLTEQVSAIFNDLLDTDEGQEIVRKIRFESEADDKLKGSKYGRLGLSAADVEWLHNVLTTAKNAGKSQGPTDELQAAFAAVSEGEYVPAALARSQDIAAVDRLYDAMPNTPRNRAAREGAIRAAMDTAESGFGSQLVGAQYVGELWEAPRRLGRVAPLIPTFEMTDPTAYLPVEAALPEMLFVAESTASNSSNYTTSKTGSNRVQVDAKKFVIHQMWSGEMEEDSIIPFIPFLRGQAAKSVAHYLDSLVLNGDTTNAATGNINLDDADPADTKHYLAYDGVRHVGLVDNTANQIDAAGAYTYDDFLDIKGKLVDTTYLMDWGHPVDPDDLLYVADPGSVDSISKLDEVLTVDKYGPQATVLNGEQGRIAGRHPLIASIAVSKTEADGKVSTTGSNNTLGQTVVFNKSGFALGWRRRVQVEVERIPATDQTRIVYSLRNGLGRYSPTGAASGIESAAVIFNATL